MAIMMMIASMRRHAHSDIVPFRSFAVLLFYTLSMNGVFLSSFASPWLEGVLGGLELALFGRPQAVLCEGLIVRV